MKNSKKVKIVAFDMGPDYYYQIRERLVARGIDCDITKVKSFCLLYSPPLADVDRLRKALRKENDEIIVFIPGTTELFLEEPDFIILFSGYKSWYDPERVKIIPYIWECYHSSKLQELPELKEIKWTNKPDLSVGFLGNSYESRKLFRLAAYLPIFLKQQLLKGRHLRYVYTSSHKKNTESSCFDALLCQNGSSKKARSNSPENRYS